MLDLNVPKNNVPFSQVKWTCSFFSRSLQILGFLPADVHLPYKVIFLKFLGEETTSSFDLGEEEIAQWHILVKQKIPYCKQTADSLLY